jgi:arylsulfatase A-like enzyme
MKTYFASAMICTCLCLNAGAATATQAPAQQRPNILFVIMDDLGIDQLRSFGYGGLTAPTTPVLDTVAHAGLRFRNVWAMPECSPSRAMFFEGRYPLRTNILTAILSTDLANSQVSPFEATTPKILKSANYKSALFGKFHLAGPTNNPYGEGTPNSVGFDYFDGFLEGAPHPIDTTAGGITITGGNSTLPSGPYSCGFVPAKKDDATYGSDMGACYFADKRGCKLMTASSTEPTPGRSCMEQGGIFVPAEMGGDSCRATPPSQVNFNLANGYYVVNLVTNELKTNSVDTYPLTDPRAREYSPIETTDAAISWIKSQPTKQPWMATVSYAAIHAPYQQAPQSLTPGESDLSGVHCTGGSIDETRTLSNQMIQAMDSEIGRLLVETGAASRKPDGTLAYDPSASNVMVVITCDNGTYAPGVKAPFDLTHAKGFVNQTGVWVPLIVSGPLVNTPNRDVENMVNVADLFQLWGEIAGLDVRSLVPQSRLLDSVSMLPYLTNPAQPSLRSYNFTQTGINITAHDARPGPCVITIPSKGTPIVNTCVQIFPQKGLCEQEGGVWYGTGTTVSPVAYASCCALQNATGMDFTILPLSQAAVRNDSFKLIQVTNENCTAGSAGNDTISELQFYRIDQAPAAPLLDYLPLNLITNQANPTQGMTDVQAAAFVDLRRELFDILGSESQCPGDVNGDGVVDGADISNWALFHNSGSSWADFDLPITNGYDGLTDKYDRDYILENLGRTCSPR